MGQSRSAPRCDESIQKIVLVRLELTYLGEKLVAVALHGVGMALGIAMLPLGQRRLRHQCPETCFFGFLGQVGELFVGDSEIARQGLQAFRDVPEASFDQRAAHAAECSDHPAGCRSHRLW